MGRALGHPNVMVLLLLGALAGGCSVGDVEDQEQQRTAPEGDSAASPARQDVADASGCRPESPSRDERPVVEITAVEYAFQDVPESISPGTELCLYNAGDEMHDMAVHYAADETAPTDELVPPQHPQVGVVSAPPDAYGLALKPQSGMVEPLILEDPGRYLLYSVIGEGTDAAAFSEFLAASEEAGELVGEPPFGAGEPDFFKGMVADLTVEGEVPTAAADPNLVLQVLERDGRFDTLHDLLVNEAPPHFEGFMQDSNWNLTLLAPTDEALAAQPEAVMEQLRSDPGLLTQVLDYHIVADYLPIEEIEAGTLPTVGGVGPLPVTVDGDTVAFDGVQVAEANIEASNAIVHAIDDLLVPSGVQLAE